VRSADTSSHSSQRGLLAPVRLREQGRGRRSRRSSAASSGEFVGWTVFVRTLEDGSPVAGRDVHQDQPSHGGRKLALGPTGPERCP